MANRLGDILVQEGLVTQPQLDQAVQQQQQSGEFLGKILVGLGAFTEAQLVDALSRQPGVQRLDMSHVIPDKALAPRIPQNVARRRGCVPIQVNGRMLQVGMVDPLDDKAIDFLGQTTGLTIQACAIGPDEFESAFAALYGTAAPKPKESGGEASSEMVAKADADKLVKEAVQELADDDLEEETTQAQQNAIPLEIDHTASPLVRIVNAILIKALKCGASDIHVEPQEEVVRVRYRIDGALHNFFSLPISVRASLTSRIKVMSEMDLAEHRIPQDGRIKLDLGGGKALDLRVNTLPGVLGEKVVMRLLGTGQLKGRVADLGFGTEDLKNVENALAGHFGMILVTGPTGSGKTTTLYTMLNQVNEEAVNIVTAEDPVEYNLAGIHQVAVRPQIGFTFDTALRSFLRQDPDIILVGEMRDYETAAIAVKAALTGHLVLSTLHTNDAPSTAVRLVDMGIEPYLVSSAVKLIIAQRLVRKICTNCKAEAPLADAEKTDLSESVLASVEAIYRGAGCDQCNNLGNKGRLPIFEVMPIRSREMRRVITEGGTEVQVAHVAMKEGLRSLRESALMLINEGVIELEEGIRVALAD